MLPIQKFLSCGKTIEDLQLELAIKVYHHPSLPLVGFSYDHIKSPKYHEVVKDCRGIVLELNTWNVVAKPFQRFYNFGEDLDNQINFDWNNFTATSKEDGSLIIVSYYAGEWHVSTSGSFGFHKCNGSEKTWRELFWETSKIDPLKLDPGFTYIFELCTIYNKVVRIYPKPTTYLLTIFQLENCQECSIDWVNQEAIRLGVPRPEQYSFTSISDVRQFILQKENEDKTFEGVIICDKNNCRYKIKSSTYIALHYLGNNGNIAGTKSLVDLVLADGIEEAIVYFPEIESSALKVKQIIEDQWFNLRNVWESCWKIENQKEFAMAICDKTAFPSLLFSLRKTHKRNQTDILLKEMWRSNGESIKKFVLNKLSQETFS